MFECSHNENIKYIIRVVDGSKIQMYGLKLIIKIVLCVEENGS